jgi:uncharacterized alkaline shock family protein YloU
MTTIDTDDADVAPADEPAQRPARIGQNELGRIEVEARAVEKIAALAAIEIPNVSGTAGRLLSRAMSGAMSGAMTSAVSSAVSGAVSGTAGANRRRPATRLPKVSADVDGELAFLEVELAVRWPAPVGRVTEEVRQHLFVQVRALLGLEVSEVNIQVVELPGEAVSARVA